MDGFRAAAYVRVSRDKSQGGRKGEIISPAQQMVAIQRVLDETGWELSHEEKDIDYSGYRIHYTKRPGLMRLLEAAKNREFQALIVYKIDRIGRTASEQLEIISTFEGHGCRVISATERFDTRTPSGRLARNLQAPISQFYSEQLSENIRDAKLTMVAEKRRPPGGQPPYGYRWENKRLVPDPGSAPVIKQMFEIALSVGKIQTCQRIWEYLDREGVRPKSGRPWSLDSIRYVLRNPIYIGKQRYLGELYEVDVEPLVSKETWNAVQAIVGKGKSRSTFKRHLLSGFIHCTWEGHLEEGWSPSTAFVYEHQSGHGDNPRYVCRMGRRYPQGRGRCPRPILAREGLERALVQELMKWVRRQGQKDFSGDIAVKAEIEETTKALEKLGAELSQVSGMINALFEDYHKYRVITREQFAERNAIYLEEQAQIKTEYERLEYRLGLLEANMEAQADAKIALEDSWYHLDFDEKRQVLVLLIKRILVYDDRLTVETYGEPFDIHPTLIYRHCLYFAGQEPRANVGMFTSERNPSKNPELRIKRRKKK